MVRDGKMGAVNVRERKAREKEKRRTHLFYEPENGGAGSLEYLLFIFQTVQPRIREGYNMKF
jgi:hypothetical protein